MNATLENLSDIGIRKAAILVACLDRAAADAVLEQLPPEEARQVRRAVVVLDEIPANEQQRVLDEFCRLGPKNSDHLPEGIELGGRLAREIGPKRFKNFAKETSPGESKPQKPFVRLSEAEDEKLARLLADERPQTIALVLSHLSSRQAGGVLSRLQANLQTEVIRRLVDLEETDPVVLQEVEQALESRLSRQVRMQRRRVAGLDAISGILDASESDVRLQILDNLAERDRTLAERLVPPSMEFEDLSGLDNASLVAIFRAADPQWIMPALLGASPNITERVLRLMPRASAESLRRKLTDPGPIRLSDVETARQRILDVAVRVVYAKKGTEVGGQRSEVRG